MSFTKLALSLLSQSLALSLSFLWLIFRFGTYPWDWALLGGFAFSVRVGSLIFVVYECLFRSDASERLATFTFTFCISNFFDSLHGVPRVSHDTGFLCFSYVGLCCFVHGFRVLFW
ncbi:hypothetical protein K440DRAFT_612229 [Wilcoxina mikolae CBS 423.85]|nr:hypothetical protein K440DRAFT_612229 [Wilcoxina mikolae CBS 423.85]